MIDDSEVRAAAKRLRQHRAGRCFYWTGAAYLRDLKLLADALLAWEDWLCLARQYPAGKSTHDAAAETAEASEL